MNKKTKGAWIIYQASKLQFSTGTNKFDNAYSAGKAGILLSAISKDSNGELSNDRLQTLANASNINKLELSSLLNTLQGHQLIDIGKTGIEVLGVTSESILRHTANIFEGSDPSNFENAAIELCEDASTQPVFHSEIGEKLADEFLLTQQELEMLFDYAKQVGFVDFETIKGTDDLFFNGNIFRRENVEKVNKVLDTLSADEQSKMKEFNDHLNTSSCVPQETAIAILGNQLFSKLASIGLYDLNTVSNPSGNYTYITKPSAFTKFSNALEDDIFDLAKMFVSSLTYGMTRSDSTRGRITMIVQLLEKLIRGEEVGPVDAIGEDYKVLELKNVIQVTWKTKGTYYGPRTGYVMKLLKKEIGILALEVIKKADASEHSLKILPTAAVNQYKGPEINRSAIRKTLIKTNPKETNDILLSLRTGGTL